MDEHLTIERVSVRKLSWTQSGRGTDKSGFYPVAADNAKTAQTSYVLTIETDGGVTGEYAWTKGVNGLAAPQIESVAHYLIGKDAFKRERIWNDLQRVMRKYDRIGIGPIDIALWDIAGKAYGASVSQLLGGYRETLPTYVSTLHAGEEGPMSTSEAFADFAVQCRELGYPAFKLHGWNDGPIAREIKTVHAIRSAVGDDMDLMLDPACAYRTFADALKVGRACDEANYFWYEDPYQDGGVSSFAHRKLRELIRTPLLLGEHIRGFAQHVDQILAGGTDFVRADAGLDAGITGVMKIAHAAEGLGLDVELHGPSPAHRQCMSALRNSNYYELGLVAPTLTHPSRDYPIFAEGYSDDLDVIDSSGSVTVPTGPGLGVPLNWDWIRKNQTAVVEFE